jgi:Raf kinase inhibitor-like YbhB/YbcL family protein
VSSTLPRIRRWHFKRNISTVDLPAGLAIFASTVALMSISFASSRLSHPLDGQNGMAFTITSPSFSNGADIPKKFTCAGPDVSPQLSWTEPPPATKSFALLVDDPDAPAGNWNHWTLWNLPPTSRGLEENVSKEARLPDGTQQGVNDFHKTGYNGPCPPAGKPHRYYFKLFALDTKLELKPGSGKPEVESAMKGHITAQAEWMGTYKR